MTEVVTQEAEGNSHWFLNSVQRRLYELDMNLLGMIVGPPGIGKSFLGLRLAEKIDPTFDVSRVVFDGREFVKILNGLEDPKGKVVLFDESGQSQAYGHRSWFSTANKVLGDVFQSYRYKNMATFFTLPSPNLLDLVGRGLQHLMLRVTARGLATVYKIEPNYHPPGPEVRHRRLGRIRCGLPSKKLVEDYLAKKTELLKDRYKQFEERLEPPAQPKEGSKSRADEILEEVRKNPVPLLDERGRLNYRKVMSSFNCSTGIAYTVIEKWKNSLPSSPGAS